MTEIEELKKVLNELPLLEVRLKSWENLIKNFDIDERSMLLTSIKFIEQSDINQLKSSLEIHTETYSRYEQILTGLLKRFKKPIDCLNKKIENIEFGAWKIKVSNFKQDSINKSINKANQLAQFHYDSYNFDTHGSEYHYIISCEHLVTPQTFEKPYLAIDSSNGLGNKKRDLYYEAFLDWKPNEYCSIYYKKLRELFKSK